jgi:hypothetical protein
MPSVSLAPSVSLPLVLPSTRVLLLLRLPTPAPRPRPRPRPRPLALLLPRLRPRLVELTGPAASSSSLLLSLASEPGPEPAAELIALLPLLAFAGLEAVFFAAAAAAAAASSADGNAGRAVSRVLLLRS